MTLARHLDRQPLRGGAALSAGGPLLRRRRVPARIRGERVEPVRLAGLLHDIGKLAVSDQILKKPGPLSGRGVARDPRAPARRRRDAECGRARGSQLDGCAHITSARTGAATPTGCSASKIPIEARILVGGRQLRGDDQRAGLRLALRTEEARTELRRCSGTQFDGEVVDAFLACGVTGRFSVRRRFRPRSARRESSGASRARTGDLLAASQTLSQLSYSPRTVRTEF